jgi:crotonobetainyl-CoA:carnitine CoA-transferase CaiB-like acyl-CoA transferase
VNVAAATISTELTDVTVVELGTAISGAFAARILGDFGASVVKVESPQGDPLRDREAAGSLDGTMFEYLNWNKSSLVVDLSSPSRRGGPGG